MSLTGNVGVQVVQDGAGLQRLGASSGDPAVPLPVSTSQDYTETLPSLNLSLRVAGRLIVLASGCPADGAAAHG